MEVRNCRRCGKMFIFAGRDVCPQCRAAEEEEFELVREYLRKNPRADIEELYDETGVKKEVILGFLREGRLEVNESAKGGIGTCQICGKRIPQGRICPECLKNFKVPPKKGRELLARESERDDERGRPGGRMYTANRLDRRRGK